MELNQEEKAINSVCAEQRIGNVLNLYAKLIMQPKNAKNLLMEDVEEMGIDSGLKMNAKARFRKRIDRLKE
ncbi:unnamed protein product, partial [Mesorhabditis belari]|uniref:Uncharacterized protein n=1 Tax=Mesorhabditis belari TaxID=2138241 RepID=A0AAF3FIK0_9BILA